jgi:hypothetical protein
VSADLLRRAAAKLRGLSASGCGAPWDPELARLFDVHATLLDVDREAGEHFTSAFAAEELFAVARAVLREDGT